MATLSFTTTFNLSLSTPQFQFTDTTARRSPPTYTTGSFKITAPSGNVIYDNLVNVQSTSLCDIHCDVSANNQTTIQLPNPLENGIYIVEYQTYHSNTLVTETLTQTYDLQYASPIVSISGSVQVYTPSPLLTEYDNTVYIVNSVLPTLSRTATITYPPIMVNNVQSTPTPTVGTTATTTSTTFYSPTTVTMSVVSDLTYAFVGAGANSNFTVIDTVSGLIEFPIDATSYCKLYCGLKTNAEQVALYPNNTQLADNFALMMAYVTLIQLAQNCGQTDDIAGYVAKIEALGNFTEDCSCGSGVQQVIGLGSLVNAYNVLGANSYITVTPVTSGNTTTFTITLNPSFIATVVADGTNIANLQGQVVTLQADVATLQTNSITITSADGTVHITSTGTNPTAKDLAVRTRNSIVGEVYDNKTLSGTTPLVIFTANATPPINGSYIMQFEADFITGTTASAVPSCSYYFIKNGATTTAIGLNGTNEKRSIQALSKNGEEQKNKISMLTQLDLLSTDTINVVIVANDAHDILIVANRSLLLTRYSA